MDKISEQVLNLKYSCYVAHCPECDNDFSVFAVCGGYLDPYVYPNFCPICGYEFHWHFQEAYKTFCEDTNKILDKEEKNNAS